MALSNALSDLPLPVKVGRDGAARFTVDMAVEDIERLLASMHDDPGLKLAHQQAFRVLDDVLVQ